MAELTGVVWQFTWKLAKNVNNGSGERRRRAWTKKVIREKTLSSALSRIDVNNSD